jgi:putative phosphoribosyl transferase
MAPEFHDRREAGRRLATALAHLKSSHPLILALPRGGVPVAFEIARALNAELDLLMVRKLGAPGYPEVGIGAVVDGAAGRLVLNDAVIEQVRPSPDYVRAEVHRQLEEIERRRHAYLGDDTPIPIVGRTAIIVDDGIATGGTIRAAIEGVRAAQPARLILAVPLAPAEALKMLEGECDQIVCLATPEPFFAVGAHYEVFDQTADEEVVSLLREARRTLLPQ